MLGTLAGLGKIRVGAFCDRMGIAMRKLTLHGIVAVLLALIGLERTLPTVRIVFQVIGGVLGQGRPPENATDSKSFCCNASLRSNTSQNNGKSRIEGCKFL
jgi:hypothetical protein